MDEHTTELHCYTNGVDTVVAHSATDALAVAAETVGEDVEDIVEPMSRIDDDTVIAVWDEDAPDWSGCECRTWARMDMACPAPNGHHPKCGVGHPSKTAREWAAQGRGLVCSTEL